MAGVAEVPSYGDGVVRLTGYELSDVEAHLAGEDEQTARGFGWWPQSSTAQTVRTAFDEWATSWRTDGRVHTFAVRNNDGELLGGCQLRRQTDGTGHVSYWTSAQHRGRGYAQRALRLLSQHAAGQGITTLEAHVAADNTASQAVATGAGFGKIAEFTTDGQPMIRYARLVTVAVA